MKFVTVKLIIAIAATTCLSAAAHSQSYPAKPVRYVVPFAVGDGPDLVARLAADRLSRAWGQQVFVENRTGAGGTVGAAYVAKSPADGYTVFQCNIASNAIAQAVYQKLSYDGLNDFAMVSRLAMTANVIVVHPSMAIKSIPEFVAFAKARPGRLSYGTGGVGTSPHMSMELLKLRTSIDIVHVPYKGGNPAAVDLVGGQIPSMIANVPSILTHILAGKARPLAVTSEKRVTPMPEVPTMIESGIPGYVVSPWYGMCAPAGTPAPVLDKLHADVTRAMQAPDVRQRLADLVIEPALTSREEFAAFVRSELERWETVVRDARIPRQ
ncbi:MAG TPA: tripartite tricarboxylate transporter substrate binding protein [Burkholderiales bacterium]|nr:tripartite tricarboxylate transporter substrate binding protein [Burkholderiales bacterium]